MTTPLWKGPVIDGITQSMLSDFAVCPYQFYLYAILGLGDGEPLNENLIWGDVFHKGLEHYIVHKNYGKACAEIEAYLNAKYPTAPKTYNTSIKKMLLRFSLVKYEGDWKTEIVFRETITTPSDRQIVIRGKLDALKTDHPKYGRILGEHKCKGYIDPDKARRELTYDRQLNVYCYLHNIEWVNYDYILIPEAVKYKPARNYNQTPTQWMESLFTGPCGSYGGLFPINSNSHNWIAQLTIPHPKELQEEYWDKTLYPEIERICLWYEWVTQSGFDHENPKFYNELFYRTPIRQFQPSMTEKFQCKYYNYLIGEKSLENLPKIKSIYQELEE